MMDLTVQQVGDVSVVRPLGDVDLLTAPDMERGLAAEVETGRTRLVLDLTGVPFMGSVGLRVILGVLKASRQGGGDLRLAGAQPGVAKMLRVAGATDVMRIFATCDEAIASYAPAAAPAAAASTAPV